MIPPMLLTQPPGSKLCGHCCLAVLISADLEHVIGLIGHKRGTQIKELTRYLPVGKTTRGLPAKGIALCIARPLSGKSTGSWHWIVWREGKIYDPLYGIEVESDWYFNAAQMKVSSHIPVNL